MSTEDFFEIGHVVKPHGFKGEITIALEDSGTHLKKPVWLFLMIDGGHVPFFIERFSRSVNTALAKLEDVSNEIDAKNLVGKPVFVQQATNPSKTDKNAEREMAGFAIVDKTLGELAVVKELMELPHQTLVVAMVNGKEILIPFIKPVIQKVDWKKRTLFVDLPAGLIDIY